jgi:hypothetical protein
MLHCCALRLNLPTDTYRQPRFSHVPKSENDNSKFSKGIRDSEALFCFQLAAEHLAKIWTMARQTNKVVSVRSPALEHFAVAAPTGLKLPRTIQASFVYPAPV